VGFIFDVTRAVGIFAFFAEGRARVRKKNIFFGYLRFLRRRAPFRNFDFFGGRALPRVGIFYGHDRNSFHVWRLFGGIDDSENFRSSDKNYSPD
jgi:hypothetical protein